VAVTPGGVVIGPGDEILMAMLPAKASVTFAAQLDRVSPREANFVGGDGVMSTPRLACRARTRRALSCRNTSNQKPMAGQAARLFLYPARRRRRRQINEYEPTA
jgi:hypothetical protein